MYEDDYIPSSKVPGPRNMKLSEVPRSEMDNVNTPDLDQGADSILRPGETLEDDFDVEFRRPNAQGGVIGKPWFTYYTTLSIRSSKLYIKIIF